MAHGSDDRMRASKFVWAVRLLQLLIAIAVLALAGVNIADYTALTCSVPGRLAYNIAAAAISLPLLLYLLLTTGPPSLRGWHALAQLPLDLILLALWLAATGLAVPSCDAACNACAALGASVAGGGSFLLRTSALGCRCSFSSSGDSNDFRKRAVEGAARHVAAGAAPVAGMVRRWVGKRSWEDDAASLDSIERPGTLPARLGLDGLMALLLLVSLVAGVVLFFLRRRAPRDRHAPPAQVEQQHQPPPPQYAETKGHGETDVAGNPVHA